MQKTPLSLYFYFNNSATILTKIVSRFRISIQNRNPTSAVWLASFLKYVTKNWLLFEQFSSDFNDLHVNLTRIVPQIHSCFRNKNWTSVARTATILVCTIEFPSQNQKTTPNIISNGNLSSFSSVWLQKFSKSGNITQKSYKIISRSTQFLHFLDNNLLWSCSLCLKESSRPMPPLKGQRHKIFASSFFAWISFPPSPAYAIRTV